MRILLIHSDYLNYNVKNKTPVAEEIEDAKKQGAFDESLVVFTAVEKDDENNPQGIVKNLVKEVIKTNDQVKAENIVLYPYAHLSSSLSSPKVAVQVLKDAEEALIGEGLNVKRVPFGWYKAFEISCKGHPLSELSRTITAEEEDEEQGLRPCEERPELVHALPPFGLFGTPFSLWGARNYFYTSQFVILT